MNYLIEKSLCKALENFLTTQVWAGLSKERKLAILELVERYSLLLLPTQYGSVTTPSSQEIENFAKEKLRQLERDELLAVLKNNILEFPDINVENYIIRKTIFQKIHKNMIELIEGLKKLTFEHLELEKRRVQILDAIEKRISVPSDELDLYVLNYVVPGAIDEENKKKIDEWLAKEKSDKEN